MSEELNEIEEVSEIDTEEQERLEQERLELERQQELEHQEAEEKVREQARIEHENFLKSFPNTTVFYQELKEQDNVKWLCGVVTNAALADQLGFLNNHYDFSELTLKKGVFYLKGYEKPDETEQALIEQKINEIDSQLEQYMDNKVHVEKNYQNIVSTIVQV